MKQNITKQLLRVRGSAWASDRIRDGTAWGGNSETSALDATSISSVQNVDCFMSLRRRHLDKAGTLLFRNSHYAAWQGKCRACAWQPLFYAATRTHCESGNDHAALSRFDPERTTISVFWLWWGGRRHDGYGFAHTAWNDIRGDFSIKDHAKRDFERRKLYFWAIQVGRDVTERA